MGAGLPAKNATRWMAPAAPVFAGKPAPTGIVGAFGFLQGRYIHRNDRNHTLRRMPPSRPNGFPNSGL
ncbi:protein of unknown function [Pseudomonas sp. JV551A1]|uniref:Uncharacterized protein n=1 Tax=Pseudomonas inefficax TaxID=2078786 RepID=A0AAQ1P9K9_9PSED|nr:protein of unknown function [Pseudomonas sp. JV551A1]SPO61198.1 protein of unknown function [Pseudomonas inefficax]